MITEEDFEVWKDNKVTKELFRRLAEQLELIEYQLLDESKYSTDGLLVLKRLCGERDAIDQILILKSEDFIDENKSSRV